MQTKLSDITKYFGFLMPLITWSSLIIVCIIHPLDVSEPLSQFGYYPSTQFIFGISLTLGSICWYLYSRHLDRYWSHTSFVTLVAGIFYLFVAWIPYKPYVDSYVLDTHNLMVALAATLYSAPMLFIGYKKKHEKLSRISFTLFFVIFSLVVGSLIARVAGYSVMYWQLATIALTSIWLIMTNKLLLEDLAVSDNPRKL